MPQELKRIAFRRSTMPHLLARLSAALLLGCLALAGAATATAADSAPTPLDKYFEGLTTLRATFTQRVKDARGKEVDSSSGTLVVSRPGKFRWEIHPKAGGSGQLLVADGKNVWFFDRDLEQITVKPVDAALSSTPAMLLSGAADLRQSFTLTSAGTRDSLDWVLVEPRKGEADFRRALFGFSKGNLQRMIIDDRLGQTATIDFDSVTRNAKVAPDEVSFTPPAGADVIGKPVS